MLPALAFLAVGAVVLYLGADAAVRGAGALARALAVRAFALGALLFGIDLEGLGTALVAAGRGQTILAAGEIFGSVLFLFSAAFGVALLVAPRPVPSPDPAMVLAPSVPVMVAAVAISDRAVGRVEGGLLVVLYLAYAVVVVMQGRRAREEGSAAEGDASRVPAGVGRSGPTVRAARLRPAVTTLLGLAAVYGGSLLLVEGGTRVLGGTQLSAGFVGAAVLGVLVSLDEILLSVLPVRQGSPELATGNLLGTLAAFSTAVLGLAALVRPVDLDSAASLAFLGAVALYAVVATVFVTRGRAGRGTGVAILLAYVAWLAWAAST